MSSELTTCKTKKKSFLTREEAEQFARYLSQTYPNQVNQHAYACEDCTAWHLSALPPESFALAQGRLTPVQDPVSRPTCADHKVEITELLNQGSSFAEISQKTGLPYQNVYNACINWGLHKPKQSPTRLTARPIKRAPSVESLSSEEAELQARLREIQAKRQLLLEAKKLKIGPYNGSGVMIQKEGNALALSFGDAQELGERLVDYLAARQPTAA